LAVADIRAGLIGDGASPLAGNDAHTAVATMAPSIHFNVFSSLRGARASPHE
jgi:hypothetical protein